jgi:hypothetical protein
MSRTNLSHYFVVFQCTPGYVDAVIVPVGPGHISVDISIYPCHAAWKNRVQAVVGGLKLSACELVLGFLWVDTDMGDVGVTTNVFG